MTITATATEPTYDEIERAILDALSATNDEFVPWVQLRERIRGSHDAKAGALDRLWIAGEVYVVRHRGCNLVALGNAHDRQMAAKARSEGRVRAWVIL